MRVGSLSLDQAGSVVALFAAAYFFNSYVASMSPAYLIGLVGALAMVVGTTLAAYLGAFRADFVHRRRISVGLRRGGGRPPPPRNLQHPPTDADGSEGFGASSAPAPGVRDAARGNEPSGHAGDRQAGTAPSGPGRLRSG